MISMDVLAPATKNLITSISLLECVKPFVLVGGTALSLQLHTRQSEDLDFMRWREGRTDKLDVEWPVLRKQLEKIGNVSDIDIADFNQVTFVVEGVKVTFYAVPRYRLSGMKEIQFLNNIRLADVDSIGAMKMEAMLRRNKFRDYYDLYSILKQGADIHQLVEATIKHSEYRLKEKNLLAMLTNGNLYRTDSSFKLLKPVYDVTPTDIEEYIKSSLLIPKYLSSMASGELSEKYKETIRYAVEHIKNTGLHTGFKWVTDSFYELCELLKSEMSLHSINEHEVVRCIASQCTLLLSQDQVHQLSEKMTDLTIDKSIRSEGLRK